MSTLQVDRIIPYQSSSVTVEGLSAPNLATTGSNTFVGNQNIQGTITASIQEGFALVGGVGDVSTLVATSSFGTAIDTSSLATTGSNIFTATQTITGSAEAVSTTISSTTVGVVSGSNGSRLFSTQLNNSDNSGGAGQNKVIMLSATPQRVISTLGTAPSILATGPTGAPMQVIEFQSQGTYTDGRVSFKVPAEITGSLTISGSDNFDLVVRGKQSIIGPTTGQVPQLIISSSDATNTINRNSTNISNTAFGNTTNPRLYQLGKVGFDYPLFSAQYTDQSSSLSNIFTDNLTQTASFTVGVFDNAFTQDVELVLETTTTNGILFKDYDNGGGGYTTFLKIAPNVSSNPPLEFKRSTEVTGSVSISDVLQLAQKDPLPAGAVGQLAVSGSNLYYNNGATWTQIN
jgi:hypothetical protein